MTLCTPGEVSRQKQCGEVVKATVLELPRNVTVKQVPDARIERPTDVPLRIGWTDICGSDLRMYDGRTIVDRLARAPLEEGSNAYLHFDAPDMGWSKIVLMPSGVR